MFASKHKRKVKNKDLKMPLIESESVVKFYIMYIMVSHRKMGFVPNIIGPSFLITFFFINEWKMYSQKWDSNPRRENPTAT